ncbi:MAG TPA: glycine cleavage T C-terminal barrel domain-containing protein [Acidimicrobiales bacterium]|nr:glycine cleavage T C-terminal barrel domain-containing protein [Acidimicrobiales bacterium]
MDDVGWEQDYRSLRSDVGAVWVPRDVVRVAGPEAISYLQGQLSQDVEALTVGASAESLLLSPQGKIDALVRATRTADDELLIDVDGGYGEAVVARLRRFKLRTKVDIEALHWRCLALRGLRAIEVAPDTHEWAGLTLPADWPGVPGVDLVGEEPPVPDGARLCSSAAWESVRVEAGVPTMGAELTERTIPAETGVVERAVSFTKGCYTGQELVARIDARGSRVPRHLRGLVLGGADAPPVGAAVIGHGEKGERELGQLTSVALSPTCGGPVALAYVRREVEPPADVIVRWGEGEASGRVEALPLVA